MKQVILVNIKGVFISNETLQPVVLSEQERLMSSIFPDKYSYVEVYTLIKRFSGKTYKKIENLIDDFSEQNKIYDFHCITIKN